MPGLNQTGPQGAGPRTGWGMGRCATPVITVEERGSDMPVTQNIPVLPFMGRQMGRGCRGCGKGFGNGNGRGRGVGNRFR